MIPAWPVVTVRATVVVARGKMQKHAAEAHLKSHESKYHSAVMMQR